MKKLFDTFDKRLLIYWTIYTIVILCVIFFCTLKASQYRNFSLFLLLGAFNVGGLLERVLHKRK